MKILGSTLLPAFALMFVAGVVPARTFAQSPTPTPRKVSPGTANAPQSVTPGKKAYKPRDRSLAPVWPMQSVETPVETTAPPRPAKGSEADARALFERAIVLLRSQKGEEALALLREAEKLEPRRPALLLALGAALLTLRRYDEATQAFKKVIEVDTRIPEGHAGVCDALVESGRHIEAIDECREAVQLDPRSLSSRAQLAQAYRLDGRLDEAFQALESVYARAQNHYLALGVMGDLYFDRGEFARAAEIYEQMISRWPLVGVIHLRLSGVYEYLDRPAEAIASARKYAELAPNLADAHFNLGERLKNAGFFDESIAPLLKATTIDPGLGGAYAMLSESYELIGDKQNAINSLKHAYRYLPPSVPISLRYGTALAESGRYADAVQPLERANAMEPDQVEIMGTLGLVYSEISQFDKGIDILTRASALAPNSREIAQFLEAAQGQKHLYGRFDEIRAFVQKNPDNLEWRHGLALVYRSRGMLKEAENEHLEIIRRAPKDATHYNRLRIFYSETGQFEKALEYLRKAIELDPNHAFYMGMAWLLRDLGRLDEAIVAGRRSVELKPTSYYSRISLGEMLLQKGNREDALREFQAAFELASGEIAPNVRLVSLYVQMGNKEGAIRHYQILKGLEPGQLKALERSLRVRFGSIQ